MKDALRTGLGFGITSGVITTLGLTVGLYAGTHSQLVVIAGILTIAIADACSDAAGIHVAEEYKRANSSKDVWVATGTAFITKFLVALTFVVPIIFIPNLAIAVAMSVVWGMLILVTFSYHIAKSRGDNPLHVIGEHLAITMVVIAIANYLPDIIRSLMG